VAELERVNPEKLTRKLDEVTKHPKACTMVEKRGSFRIAEVEILDATGQPFDKMAREA
jgi:hypothetical protein